MVNFRMENGDFVKLVEFDDGHSPGSTKIGTKLALYDKKYSSNFFCVFDQLMPTIWCDRAYKYAVDRNKPWGK